MLRWVKDRPSGAVVYFVTCNITSYVHDIRRWRTLFAIPDTAMCEGGARSQELTIWVIGNDNNECSSHRESRVWWRFVLILYAITIQAYAGTDELNIKLWSHLIVLDLYSNIWYFLYFGGTESSHGNCTVQKHTNYTQFRCANTVGFPTNVCNLGFRCRRSVIYVVHLFSRLADRNFNYN